MPPVMSLNDQRVWQVVGFVRTLGDTAPVEAAKGNPVKGKAVYEANGCATCHAMLGKAAEWTATDHIGKTRPPKYFYEILRDPGKNPPADTSLPERGQSAGYLLVHVVTKGNVM